MAKHLFNAVMIDDFCIIVKQEKILSLGESDSIVVYRRIIE